MVKLFVFAEKFFLEGRLVHQDDERGGSSPDLAAWVLQNIQKSRLLVNGHLRKNKLYLNKVT